MKSFESQAEFVLIQRLRTLYAILRHKSFMNYKAEKRYKIYIQSVLIKMGQWDVARPIKDTFSV